MAFFGFIDTVAIGYVHPAGRNLPDRYHQRFADEFLMLQFARTRSLIRLLFATAAVLVISAAVAAPGMPSMVERWLVPIIAVVACLFRHQVWRRRAAHTTTIEQARRHLQTTVISVAVLLMMASTWALYMFSQSNDPMRVLQPVFVLAATMVTANCLASYPRAALTAALCGAGAMSYVLIVTDDLAIRAAAVSGLFMLFMQVRLASNNFDDLATGLALRIETERLADTDPLTGADNRRRFTAMLETELDRMRKCEIAGSSIAMIDLNGFKPVNDNHGHAAGDQVLIDVARRLRTLFASAPCIARIGGDEFAVLFAGDHSDETARVRTDAIRAVLSLPYCYDGISITISASVGFARFERDGDTVSALMQAADRALYEQKGAQQTAVKLSA